MKVINWVGAAASVVVMAGCGGALAADLSPLYDEPFIQDVPEMQPVEIGTGWFREESEIMGGDFDHRWSQAKENRIGGGGFFGSNERPTLPFNGYGDEVASLYDGMDLTVNF